jgi:flagellar basal body-associated protein FliL
MNKKILVGIVITIIAIAGTVVGLKTILGDKATELPGEEHAEKTLNFQEANKTTVNTTGSIKSGSTTSGESGETGP